MTSDQIKDRLTLEEMVQSMKRHFELINPYDYHMALEFSLLSRMRGYLPSDICVYILFHGPSGTGKSHAGQFVTEISNGDWLQAISEGALLAGVSSGKLIGIDEIDGQQKRIEATEDILRVGHTWDASYRKMIPTEKGFQPQNIKCGGPKVLTSIGLPEEALASRCYTIEMTRSSNTPQYSVAWAYRKDDVLKIAATLDLIAKEAKENFDWDSLKAWQMSPEHMAELERLRSVHARRTDLAHVFSTIDHIIGWNLPCIIEAMAKESMDDEKETLRTYLIELEKIERDKGLDVGTVGIRPTRILEYVNQRRHDANQKSHSMRSLGRALTELGFTDPANKVHRAEGIFYLFNEKTHRILCRELPITVQTQITQVSSGGMGYPALPALASPSLGAGSAGSAGREEGGT